MKNERKVKMPERPSSKLISKKTKESFIPASESTLLEWLDNSRVAFWAWIYIRGASCENLNVSVPDMEATDTPYFIFKMHAHTESHKERVSIIKRWFEEMEKRIDIASTYKVMREMKHEWSIIFHSVKGLPWLTKDAKSTMWAWEYINERAYFKNSFLKTFAPTNPKERFLAVSAVFDVLMPDEYSKFKDAFLFRKALLEQMKRAYLKRMATQKDEKNTFINVKISNDAKNKLKVMATKRGCTQRELIEALIRYGNIDD